MGELFASFSTDSNQHYILRIVLPTLNIYTKTFVFLSLTLFANFEAKRAHETAQKM
jgi:hypothetical protein